MQINNKGWQKGIPSEQTEYDDDGIQRDLELENIAGNLMIAEYPVYKLRQRLSQQVRVVSLTTMDSTPWVVRLNSVRAQQ